MEIWEILIALMLGLAASYGGIMLVMALRKSVRYEARITTFTGESDLARRGISSLHFDG